MSAGDPSRPGPGKIASDFGDTRSAGKPGVYGGYNPAFRIRPWSQSAGETGRRIQFWPASGRAMQKFVRAVEEKPVAVPALPPTGDLELF